MCSPVVDMNRRSGELFLKSRRAKTIYYICIERNKVWINLILKIRTRSKIAHALALCLYEKQMMSGLLSGKLGKTIELKAIINDQCFKYNINRLLLLRHRVYFIYLFPNIVIISRCFITL